MKKFALYGTSACHLCEVAEVMAADEVRVLTDVEVEKIDISESDGLFERYGIAIPVLAHPDGRELRWPFQQNELGVFLRS